MAKKKKVENPKWFSPLALAYPNIVELVDDGGRIELGFCYYTQTYARAHDEGGTLWSGGTREMTMEELLEALDEGIAEFNEEYGH